MPRHDHSLSSSCLLAAACVGAFGQIPDSTRMLFAYPASAPLNLTQKLLSETSRVRTSEIQYDSPRGDAYRDFSSSRVSRGTSLESYLVIGEKETAQSFYPRLE